MRYVAKIALTGVVGLTAACGSTVQYSGTATQGGSSNDGLGSVDGGTSTTAPTGTDNPTTVSAGGSQSTTTSPGGSTDVGTNPDSGTPGNPGTAASSAPGGSSVASSSGGLNAPVTGPGFTKTVIRIGVATADDYNTFASGTGLKGVGVDGDPNVWFSTMVTEINKHGGLLGRRIELVKHNYSTSQVLTDPAAANQAACTTWTQDAHVFAVVGPPIVEDTLLGCLKKANTPLIQIGAGLDYPLHYAQTYASNPLYFNLAQMSGDRFDKVAITRLVARHYFSPWNTRTGQASTATVNPVKVGIISFDDHDGSLQLASITKQLKANGMTSTSTVACPRSLTNKITCEQSAVLKFASNGVTHVINADSTFMNNASSQKYYPRYFLPIEPALFAANVPAKELIGSMSEGYIPFSDVPTDKYPGDPTPATGLCKKLMRAAGQTSDDPTTLTGELSICDGFFFLRDAVQKAGVLGAGALRAGFEKLGSSSSSALTYKTFIGPQNHASAAAVRDLVFQPDIKNFVYVSKTDFAG